MQGREDIFMHYIQPHWNGLYSVARRYTMTEEDASDLVQETLLRAWKRFSAGEDGEYRGAWLFTILRNVAVDWYRMNQRKLSLFPVSHAELTEIASPSLAEPLAPLPTMDEEQFRDFLDDRIVAALDALKVPFREVIVLSVAGELTYREIADVLDCPVGTVMSRMARARRMLREKLADFVKGPRHRSGEMEQKR